MSRNVCSYHKCSDSAYKVKGMRMFRFPKVAYLCRIWVLNSGNSDLIGVPPETLYVNKRICEKHFKKSDFLPSGRLMRDAAPIPYVLALEESDADSVKRSEDSQTETSIDPKLPTLVDDTNQLTREHILVVQKQQESKDNPTTPQSLKSNYRITEPSNSKATEPMENNDEPISNLTDLKSIVKKLDAISDKLAPNIFGDSFDQFGKYLSSLLRNLPPKRVLSMKKKFVSEVLDALLDEERQQTYRGKLFVEKKSVAVQVPDQLSNKQIFRGKGPVLLPPPGMSTNPFKLLSVIKVPPKTVYPNPQLPFVSKSVVDIPLNSGQTTTCDSVRTISSSSEGTLIEVKLPNRIPHAVRDIPDNKPKKTPPKSQRKRKTTPTVCPVKRSQTSPASLLIANTVSAADFSSNMDIVSQASTSLAVSAADGSLNMDTEFHPSTPSRLASAADGISNMDTDSQASISSILDNTDSPADASLNMDTVNTEEEIKIDIEEGWELEDVKEDPSHFETILCALDNTQVEVKEETPEEEETLDCEEDVSNSPHRLLICDMCSTSCVSKTDMLRHFSTTHSGCVPTFKP